MDFSGSGGGGGGGRVQAERWLEIAGKLLAARDLVGCKRFAERAVESDPLLPGADELLAVADVLLTSQTLLPSGQPDPVAVLQLPPNPDHAAVNRAFRRLALLLSSPDNRYPGADAALRLVQDAFSVLSDRSKKTPAAATVTPPPPPPSDDAASFWTACPYCCYVHQYPRGLVGRALKCPNTGCRRAFVAAEIPATPPVVPGTDMYYCAWGFFPLGFPNAADLSGNWKPFYRMFPWNSSPDGSGGNGIGGNGISSGNNNANTPLSNPRPLNGSGSAVGSGGRGRTKKTTARKKVGAGLKKRSLGGVESGIEPSLLGSDKWGGNGESGRVEEGRGININEAAKVTDGSGSVHVAGEEDMMGFHLDVDGSDDILGNLQHLPFLREEENLERML